MTKQHQQQETDKGEKEELKSLPKVVHWSRQKTMQPREKEDKLLSIDGDDAEDVATPSSPPLLLVAPALRRGGAITYMPTTQPGAVHVPGISPRRDGDEEQGQGESSPSTYSPTTLDTTPLVNAELVMSLSEHDNRSPITPEMISATDTTVTMNHIPAEIFDATPIKPQNEDGNDKHAISPRLSDLFKNTTVRIIMFVVLCIIVGLITGLAMGLSRQVVMKVDDTAGEAVPLFQPATSNPTSAIDTVLGEATTSAQPASNEIIGAGGNQEGESTSAPVSDNNEVDELEEETESNSETNDENDSVLGDDNSED